MGIYYNSFVNKMLELYQYEDFDDFLDLPETKKVCENFSIQELTLPWAINIEVLAKRLEVTSSHKLTLAIQILDKNIAEWENNG